VEENEVDAKPIVVDAKPALPTDEGKIITQFQQKVGEVFE